MKTLKNNEYSMVSGGCGCNTHCNQKELCLVNSVIDNECGEDVFVEKLMVLEGNTIFTDGACATACCLSNLSGYRGICYPVSYVFKGNTEDCPQFVIQ